MKRFIIAIVLLFVVIAPETAFCKANDEAIRLQDSFTAVAEKAFPAVVVINVKKDLPQASQYGGNPFFGEQFRRFRGQRNQEMPNQACW